MAAVSADYFCKFLRIVCFVAPLLILARDVAARDDPFCHSYLGECDKEHSGQFQDCYGIQTNCTYTKGFLPAERQPTVPPHQPLNYPLAPINFTVSKYNILGTGCKVPAINITWRASSGSSLYALKGFLLHVYGGQNDKVNITRSFIITMEAYSLLKAQFFYPCIVLDYLNGGQYNIRLYSLPIPSLPYVNYVSYSFNLPPLDPQNGTNTFGWVPDASVSSRPGSVQVSFAAAPVHYNFTLYEVTLAYSSSPRVIARRVQLNKTDDRDIVQVFADVAPGAYIIWIEAVVTFPCMCHVDFDCKESCTRTELTTSVPGPPTSSPSTSATTPGHKLLTTPVTVTAVSIRHTDGPGVGQIAGITVGVILAFLVVVALIFLLLLKTFVPGICPPPSKYMCCDKKKTTRASVDEPSSTGHLVAAESVAEPSYARVLLISCGSNSVHRDVVSLFVDFLQDQSDCTVVVATSEFGQRSCLTRLQQLTAHDWLQHQADLASHVILIHCDEDEQRAVQAMRSLNADCYSYVTPPQNDLFFAAIQLSAEDRIEPNKLLHVYFPYTETEFFEKARFGITFLIPEETDKLMSHLHGRRSPPFRPVVLPDGLRAALDRASSVLAGGDFIPPDDETATILSGSIMAQLNELAQMDDFRQDSGCELNYVSPQSSV